MPKVGDFRSQPGFGAVVTVIEVELSEPALYLRCTCAVPALYLRHAEGAAERLADAIVARTH